MEEENKKRTVFRGCLFVFSVFLLALCYNLIYVPNNIVIGGISGLSIVVHEATGFSPTLFIYICTVTLLCLSYFILGYEKTRNSLIGSVLYPIMITLSWPIANFLIPYFEQVDIYILAIIASIIFGFGNGIVFRYGFSTGGTDIITSILTKFFKLPEGKTMLFSNISIICIGGYVFGLNLMLLDLIILYVGTLILDKIMFDISDSKVFYVFTRNEEKVTNVILNEFKTGFTVIPTKGGYSHKEGTLIMTVLPNREYFRFKQEILEMDNKAFFIICDCYESYNGYKKENIPYM